jgi:hypothetical protein
VSNFPPTQLTLADVMIRSTNLVVILVMMQVSKKIPFDDPNVLMGVRAAYILSNLIIAGVYIYVQMLINKKKGEFHMRIVIHASGEQR